MSWEMLCVKHAVLGGLPEDLPSDIAFITERDFKTVLEFLNAVWDHPHPCYFVWCRREQLESIRKIDRPEFSLKVLKADTYNNLACLLLKVCGSTFYHLRVAKRIEINGETGWLVKTIGRKIKKW
jgi:hypothetical protein